MFFAIVTIKLEKPLFVMITLVLSGSMENLKNGRS